MRRTSPLSERVDWEALGLVHMHIYWTNYLKQEFSRMVLVVSRVIVSYIHSVENSVSYIHSVENSVS